VKSVRLLGPGRAGLSLAHALSEVGYRVAGVLGRNDDHADAAQDVDVLVIATPDDVVASVAAGVRPSSRCVVVHLAASLGLDVLGRHGRRASLHPLVPLPNPSVGAARLLSGIGFAVAGDPVAEEMALALRGRPFTVADADRAAYHAAACVAANHVVALLGQVERIASATGLDLDAFLDLSRAAIDDVARLGPAAALTGPAARGDWSTLERHRRALADEEQPGYNACAALAHRLAAEPVGSLGEQPVPEPVGSLREQPAAAPGARSGRDSIERVRAAV
jgi:predicted short-subunit dehydrogenase-like oxidoreductase (DUF2520 family)